MDTQKEIEDLKRRVEELERRPVYVPVPIPYPVYPQPFVSPTHPWYIGDFPVTVTCGGTGNPVS